MGFDPDDVQRALRKAWSSLTASQWTPDNPAAGQCNVTSPLIHELFGGELLKTPLPAGDHFYNRIGGRRYVYGEPVRSSNRIHGHADKSGRCGAGSHKRPAG